jgi:alkanesulfonate monooxygenase SsuD/methylene tetrahydromethanopterin reductase-like flavin-dependent oxidoreductase (luciferase family)
VTPTGPDDGPGVPMQNPRPTQEPAPMRLGYFTMPLHPPERECAITLEEDREAIILADRLGFHDAFIGEHLTEKSENVTNSFIFLASLIHATERILLGTGTSNLSHTHPTLIASHAAMFDHMARGRFIFGVSAGALASDAEALGTLGEDRNKLFAEAIDVILAIWERDVPYDIDFPDNRFKVTTRRTMSADIRRGEMYKPYQKPRPEIVGTVVAPYSKGVIAMGERDFHPLSANFLLSKYLRSHWENYAEGKRRVGQTPRVEDWRIARTIFVADDEKTARAYGRTDPASPYRFYWKMLLTKMMKSNRHAIFKTRPEQPDAELTLDYMVDQLVICGTVNNVVDQILALREEAGDFGEIVYAGMDWVDPTLTKRSMELMATEVMPRVNAAIGRSASPARATAG